jgi:hypothetical protein
MEMNLQVLLRIANTEQLQHYIFFLFFFCGFTTQVG